MQTSLDRVTCVLFDLDGTLIDSAPGITHCLARVQHFGGPTVQPRALRGMIGPPIIDTLRALTQMPEARLPEVVAHYRALYGASGISRSAPFPGIPALLGVLLELGIPLAVATSKRESHARDILELHRLDHAFAVVSGAGEDESASEKHLVIGAAIDRLRAAGHDVLAPLHVGDRSFDIAGASAAGIPSAYAGWGYGEPDEAIGARVVFTDPSEAGSLIQPAHLRARQQKIGTHS